MPSALAFDAISKEYVSSRGTVLRALDDISLEIAAGEIFCLVGPSGCGKTTLLNIAAGFLPATTGRVLFQGDEARGPHSRCGMAFQADAVFPWLTVADNVGYALRFNGTPPEQRDEIAKSYLHRVGLTAFADNWPRELSGGMRKRVDLARAFAFASPTLLLDEPFGSLDVLTKDDMQRLLLDIWHAEPKTVLFVTHDVEEAILLGHRVGVMSPLPGRLVDIVTVPFPHDERTPTLKLAPEFVAIRKHVLERLRQSRPS